MADRKKITLPRLFQKVANHEPITMLTCYDYPTAYFQEEAGIDMILVGDSLAMTMLGYDSTLPATMDDMIRHTQAVRRGAPTAWLVGDMPYMSYQPSVETAIRNAGRFMAEAGTDCIKLEGGAEMADRIKGIVAAGISAFPMAGRLVQKVAHEEDFSNFVLMHAMGANTAGQLGSVIAGGILLTLVIPLVGG